MEILTVLQKIQADMSALARQPKPEVAYFLDAVTPYAQVRFPDGRTFKIRQDGRTTAEIAGLDLPCPCPYPDAIWSLGTAVFFCRHRKRLPLAVFSLAALASLQLLIAMIPGAPGAAWFLDYFAAAMNAVLITLALLWVVAFALYNFGRGIYIRFGQPDTDTALLSSGQIDIAPDIHVFSTSDNEQPDTFAQRVRDAYTDMLPRGQYLLILTYRCPSGIVVRFPDTGSQEYFERANLVKTIPGWMQEVCPPTRFDRETFAEFSAYCVAFCEQFRVWSQTDKMKQGNPVKDFLHSMEAAAQKAAVILALLLCPLFASAQSMATEWQKDSVNFEEFKSEITAQCESQYPLLSPVLKLYMCHYCASLFGLCLLIGLVVFASKRVFRRCIPFVVAYCLSFGAQAQSAVPIPTNAGQSIFRSVPDSMELEALKRDMLLSKYQVGREIAPRQMFVMWTFHNWVVPIMFLFGLLAWFWAKAAFRESEHDQGGNVIFGIGIANGGHYARRIVFILAAAIAVVEIADSVIWAFFREQNLWWAAIKCVCLAVLWMYLVNWITPNPRKVDSAPMGQGFPMVGGGQKRIG